MADIANVRDKTIQAQLPRLLPITMPENVTVPVTNVPGLPDYYASAKQVELRATSQIFQISKVGGISPASIILTAERRNILGVVTWTVLSGSVTYTTGNTTLTIQAGGLTSDTATIRASVTSDGITYSDVMTIVRVEEGIDSITGFLTNESTAVPALANGSVLSYDNTGGQFRVLKGITEVTGTAVAYSVVSSTGVSISIANTGVYTVNNLTVDAGSAILQASYGGVNIQKVYTITKSKQGANGTNGTNGSNGVRGNVNIAVPTTGSIWSDAQAVAGIANAGYGLPMSRDIVTLYNLSVNFSQSKYYDGAAWQTLDAYINGNLLVTGSVVADKIDTRGLSIKDASGNVILSAGSTLKQDYIDLPVGGKNLIPNSGPFPDQAGFFYTAYGSWPGNVFAITPDPYRPKGYGGVYITSPGSPSPSLSSYIVLKNDAGGERLFPVVPGQKYEASTYISAHRCTGYIQVVYCNTSGTVVGSPISNIIDNNSVDGTAILTAANRAVNISTAPAGAAYAIFRVIAAGKSLANPYMFICQSYFGSALPQQTVASAWSDSGSGQITASNATTYIANSAIGFAAIDKATIGNLSVVSQLVGLLRTRATGARLEIADDVQKVYAVNSSGADVVVVQIGNLDA